MTPEEILTTIEKHGLSIRQIPKEVVSLYDIRHHKDGNEIVLSPMTVNPGEYSRRKSWFLKHTSNAEGYVFDDAAETIHRKFSKEVRLPQNAGCWMCQRVAGTSNSVGWSIKHHHLAQTLEGSIKLFLKSLKKDESK